MRAAPKSILDIGVGYGKYGMLAREYLDYAHFRKRDIVIDGIEGFAEYIQDGQRFYYDHIFIGDARLLLPTLGTYDMILLLDTLEHFTKEEGLQILKACQLHTTHVLVATPFEVEPQGAVYGNEFEHHRFQWRKRDLLPFGPVSFFRNPETLIALLGTQSKSIKRNIAYRNYKRFLKATFPRAFTLLRKLKWSSG
jgi:hypothetical protein